jgi:predicted naringenin-chalcone synthase
MGGCFLSAPKIIGIGVAAPQHAVPQELALSHAKAFTRGTPRQERVLSELYRRTEIQSRSSVLGYEAFYGEDERNTAFFTPSTESGPGTAARMEQYTERAPQLALQASMQALQRSSTDPADITHIVTVSCTGFGAPGFDLALIDDLQLNREVVRTHIGFMGCHGAINGLKVARSYALSEPGAKVLLCATELCSLHFQYGWNSNSLIANSLFADGAAAAVIASAPDGPTTATAPLTVAAGGSCIVPGSKDAMTWRIGDNGFLMTLSSQVPSLIEAHLPAWISSWLARCSSSVSHIENWCIHPGGPKILDAVQKSLSLSEQALTPSRTILAEFGNMSSPTVFFILDRLSPLTAPCVVLGFGPGLAVEAVLLTP